VRFLEVKPTVAHVALTLLTSMFMHGGWMHLLGNMLFLWVFGNNIEDRLGHVTFALFYVLGGMVAILCHWAMIAAPHDLLPTVGASGAVAVMLGAYAVTYPHARVTVLILLIIIPIFVKVPAMVVLGFWILGELMSAWLDDPGLVSGVAFWAHIGGFFTGALVMPILAAGTPEPNENWEKEAKEQFDFKQGEAAALPQRSGDPNRAGNWWDEIPPRRDMPVPRNDAWWTDRRGQ
jgi:membrane associated rhomboid family serine protease